MAKKVTGMVKLQLPAGKANPSPPVGPALGQHGVNIMGFCKEFNAATQAQAKEGLIVPVLITIYSDRSFTFVVKTPPAAILIKKALGLHTEKKKGSGAHKPGKEKVGTLKKKQLEQIAKTKMPDMTAGSLQAAGFSTCVLDGSKQWQFTSARNSGWFATRCACVPRNKAEARSLVAVLGT